MPRMRRYCPAHALILRIYRSALPSCALHADEQEGTDVRLCSCSAILILWNALLPLRFYCVDNILDLWNKLILQNRGERNRCVQAADPPARRVQRIKQLFCDERGNFSGISAAFELLRGNNDIMCLVYRLRDQILIQRIQSARIQNFCGDSFLLQLFCCFQSPEYLISVRDNGDIGSFSLNVALSKRNRVQRINFSFFSIC